MASFFSSRDDLIRWVREFDKEADAANRIREIVDNDQHNTDIAQSVNGIFSGVNQDHAAEVLFKILKTKELVEDDIMTDKIKKNESVEQSKLHKQAVVEKFPERSSMPLRYCPKLPRQGASQGEVSTYNCRRFCKDSIVLDDDPSRVYCGEALWRRHVMDKFSREWLDPKTGLLQGGYINDRFHTFRDELPTGEPRNSTRMSLKPGERTRQPKPYEYSTERRLQEQREKGSTESIVLNASEQAALNKKAEMIKSNPSSVKVVRIAENDTVNPANHIIESAFEDAVCMHLESVNRQEAAERITKKHGLSIQVAAGIQDLAIRKYASHCDDWYRVAYTERFEGDNLAEVSHEVGLDDDSDAKSEVADKEESDVTASDLPNIERSEEI